MNTALVQHFTTELAIQEHFLTLKSFLLLEDGEFGHALTTSLFEEVGLVFQWRLLISLVCSRWHVVLQSTDCARQFYLILFCWRHWRVRWWQQAVGTLPGSASPSSINPTVLKSTVSDVHHVRIMWANILYSCWCFRFLRAAVQGNDDTSCIKNSFLP